MKQIIRMTAVLVTLLLLLGCGSEQKAVQEYLDGAEPLLDEWIDGFNRAASTSRIALSPVIGDLQDTRRRYDALEVPDPCRTMHANVVGSMNYSIDGFLAFLSSEDQDVVDNKFSVADQRLDQALDSLSKLREEYGH